jgi:hypothetical protein
MAEAARAGDRFELSIVIDLIDLPGFPGCRGEELVAACANGRCPFTPASPRYCHTISFSASLVPDQLGEAVRQMREQLAMHAPVAADAPNGTVLVRAIATAQSCDEFETAFDETLLVGCAHSCPVQLDAVDGSIALSLDTLDDNCRTIVEACARFPAL